MDLLIGLMREREDRESRITGPEIPGLYFTEPIFESTLGGQLHLEIERRVDVKATIEQVVAESRVELFAHPLHEVLADIDEVFTRTHLDRIRLPPLGLLGREVTLIAHQIEYRVAMEQRARGITPRLVRIRTRSERSNQRRLRNVHLRG